jgi:hypothetical protein
LLARNQASLQLEKEGVENAQEEDNAKKGNFLRVGSKNQ